MYRCLPDSNDHGPRIRDSQSASFVYVIDEGYVEVGNSKLAEPIAAGEVILMEWKGNYRLVPRHISQWPIL